MGTGAARSFVSPTLRGAPLSKRRTYYIDRSFELAGLVNGSLRKRRLVVFARVGALSARGGHLEAPRAWPWRAKAEGKQLCRPRLEPELEAKIPLAGHELG